MARHRKPPSMQSSSFVNRVSSTPPPNGAATEPRQPPRPGAGRLLSEINDEHTEWFVKDMIPRGGLTMVVGDPNSGKSTFGAWLAGQAKRPAVLPGNEGSAGGAMKKRFAVIGIDPTSVLVLDDRPYGVPWDRDRIADALRDHGADLLWIDPIDSYVGDINPTDPVAVRAALESLIWIAEKVGLAAVMSRHPGKAPGNVCPDSRAWRALPRPILRLTVYPGPPERRLMDLYKPGPCPPWQPRLYELPRVGESVPRWEWKGELGTGEAVSLEVTDRHERRVLDLAKDFLKCILADGPLEAKTIFSLAEQERLNERTLRRAAEALRCESWRKGFGRTQVCWWSLEGQREGSDEGLSGLARPERQTQEKAHSGHSGQAPETPPPAASPDKPKRRRRASKPVAVAGE